MKDDLAILFSAAKLSQNQFYYKSNQFNNNENKNSLKIYSKDHFFQYGAMVNSVYSFSFYNWLSKTLNNKNIKCNFYYNNTTRTWQISKNIQIKLN